MIGPIPRRVWLRLAGGFGVSLGFPRPAKGVQNDDKANSQSNGFGRAKSVILIYLSGGQSQLETWDPKPDAPAEVRGEFNTIQTSVPGTLFGEHLPLVAKQAHLFTIVKSMSHEDLDHGSATYLTFTGRYHQRLSSNPSPKPDDFPALGAVLKRIRPSRELPYTAVHLNGPALVPELPAPGQYGGFLGKDYEPLILGDVLRNDIAMPGLDALPEISSERIQKRHQLLLKLDRSHPGNNSHLLSDKDVLYRQAFNVLDTPRYRAAFDLASEPLAMRESYGLNRSGQACLLARRLAEVGVPLTTVIWSHSNRGQDRDPTDTDLYGWDTHNDIFSALKNRLLPRFDQGFSALLRDLNQRGMLDETLVVCMGEFGRAPLVALEKNFKGSSPGRKHWAAAYSIVMAGAGITPGAVYGSTDRHAAYPSNNPVGPWDVWATIFHALGIDHKSHYHDQLNRPFETTIGSPIYDLYG